MGLKQVVHILRDARGISTVLSHTLPKGEQEVCAVLVLEQKVDFINEDEGVLALSSVLRNTVQNRVEDDQHTDGHKLLAEVKGCHSRSGGYPCPHWFSLQRCSESRL